MSAKSTDPRLLMAAGALFAASFVPLLLAGRAQKQLQALPAAFSQALPSKLGPVSLLAVVGDMRRAAADLSYIHTLQYIGDKQNRLDGGYSRAASFYREVLWLDPSFHFAVLEGSAFLGWYVERAGEARSFLETAMAVDPGFERYKLYYAALAYAQQTQGPAMLELLKAEALKPDAPEMILRMIGNLMTKFAPAEEARDFWLRLQKRSRDGHTLYMAEKNLKLLEAKSH